MWTNFTKSWLHNYLVPSEKLQGVLNFLWIMNKNIPLIWDYLSARGRTEDLRLFYKDKPTIREERLSVVSLKTKFSHQIFASEQAFSMEEKFRELRLLLECDFVCHKGAYQTDKIHTNSGRKYYHRVSQTAWQLTFTITNATHICN